MNKWSVLLVLLIGCLGLDAQPVGYSTVDRKDVLSLAGIWKFKLDPFSTGISSNGVQLLPGLPEEITLPGSTDQAGKGYKTQDMTSLRLTRMFEYKGPAWYEKEVYIPEAWKDKEIRLFLERVHWESKVWVNGKPAGRSESLSVPHIYNLSALVQPGMKNTILIRVNNDKIYDIEYSHAISAETQTNWNGIIGRIELQAFDQVHLSDVQVYPQAAQKKAKVQIAIANHIKKQVQGTLTFSGRSGTSAAFSTPSGSDPVNIPAQQVDFSGSDSIILVTADLSLGDQVQLWDEFSPVVYSVDIQLKTGSGHHDSGKVSFGIREFSTEGTRFMVNGRQTFIRSTVNSSEFPLTGYPPMDRESWTRIFKTCRDYGLNAMRFHSWCPPRAAFEAADRLGIYLQVENSDWRFTIGKDSATNRFLTEEADRIFRTYGNHPSFMMFCEGNELVGPSVKTFLSELVTRWKKEDPRRLYTGSSGYPVIPENQFNDFYGARPQRWKEGLKGRFNAAPVNTQYDYADYVEKHEVPMITHEVGQWCVFPDFDEIPKFSGVLKPYNYELFRESLREHHLLDQAREFTMASGKFQVIQKKEEIESYLRTPGFGGYSLLQLNDFPGQGTAPVGVVDVFWDPKPYVTAGEFRRFQAARVPLLRTASLIWTSNQHFKAEAQFANFGHSPVQGTAVHWSLKYPDGQVYAAGDFGERNIPVGSPIPLGELDIPLNRIETATKLDLEIGIPGTECMNLWGIWVYPEQLPDVKFKGVMIAYDWDKRVKDHLQKGGKVLLLADTAKIISDADPVFSGISWNTVWSGMPPNLLGILCDPTHPALKDFPTEYHSNWQWWDLVRHSRPMVLDHLPFFFKPLVQMIPDWNKPRKMGLIFEARAGKGSLLVCSADLRNNMVHRPVARQFLYSLENYVASEAFSPSEEVTIEMIDKLFEK
jgi:hypothetical protein